MKELEVRVRKQDNKIKGDLKIMMIEDWMNIDEEITNKINQEKFIPRLLKDVENAKG